MRLESFDQLSADWREWNNLPYTGDNRHNHQRFGQFVWNKYEWDQESWPVLFYEEHPATAYRILHRFLYHGSYNVDGI